MKQTVCLILAFFAIVACSTKTFAQDLDRNDPDIEMKIGLYNKYKKEALAYTKKDFDDLFFEFFSKMDDAKIVLTKEEYYTYTVKIAIYNERQGLLYKDRKEESKASKEKWFGKKYQDYLSSK